VSDVRLFLALLMVSVMWITVVSPSSAEEQAGSPRKRYPSYLREVVGIDREAQTITVKNKAGTEVFQIGEAKFTEGYGIGEIKPGDRISIRYVKRNGKLVATGISRGPLMNVEPPSSGKAREGEAEKTVQGSEGGEPGVAPPGVKAAAEETRELKKDKTAGPEEKKLKKTKPTTKAKTKAPVKKGTPSKKKKTTLQKKTSDSE
jgi:Cu/Ag efflux protein CusF